MDSAFGTVPPERRLFCNRTLNMSSIRAVGFDMDYTLVHYHVREWEERAYEDARARLHGLGVDVAGLAFDPALVRPGIVLDLEHGNAVKTNRFGFVKQACHGTAMLGHDALRERYAREIVDLNDRRWVFLDTWFALSEACLYLQLVDRLDQGRLSDLHSYGELYRRIRECVDAAHMEGLLKEQIVKDPTRFVDVDPELPLTLLDLKHAGKKLLLITNSEWSYTRAMMRHVLDRLLPGGTTFRELFDIVIVGARKPLFFETTAPAFRVVDEELGTLMPHVGPLLQHQPRQIKARGIGQMDVEHHHVGCERGEQRHGLGPIGRLTHHIEPFLVGQRHAQPLPVQRVIVHQQHAHGGVIHVHRPSPDFRWAPRRHQWECAV